MALHKIDHMTYLDGMEAIDSDIMDKVLEHLREYDYRQYTAQDVQRALVKEQLSIDDYAAVLSPAAMPYLEQMAQRALQETRKHFGNSVHLFTPLYIANYCENLCAYCGFNYKNRIRRENFQLTNWKRSFKPLRKQDCRTS